ncbi:MAG: PAS domain-containing protein, partial [Oscillospiraceae bacterium]|nr:PAS domain-containing protein [Oscillospiraceae bacterium]
MKLMKIAKYIMPVMIIATVTLFMIFVVLYNQIERRAQEGKELVKLSNELQRTNDHIIKLMRQFTVNFDQAILREYEEYLDTLDDLIDEFEGISYKLTSNEQSYFDGMLGVLDTLEAIETHALDAYERGDFRTCIDIINSDDYFNADRALEDYFKSLINEITQRTDNEYEAGKGIINVWHIFFAAFILGAATGFMFLINFIVKKFYWYDNILDAIPLPLSVTDVNRNTTFINKPVEEMLGVKRENVTGKPCALVWNMSICGTPDCGLECLERGQDSMMYSTGG